MSSFLSFVWLITSTNAVKSATLYLIIKSFEDGSKYFDVSGEQRCQLEFSAKQKVSRTCVGYGKRCFIFFYFFT